MNTFNFVLIFMFKCVEGHIAIKVTWEPREQTPRYLETRDQYPRDHETTRPVQSDHETSTSRPQDQYSQTTRPVPLDHETSTVRPRDQTLELQTIPVSTRETRQQDALGRSPFFTTTRQTTHHRPHHSDLTHTPPPQHHTTVPLPSTTPHHTTLQYHFPRSRVRRAITIHLDK